MGLPIIPNRQLDLGTEQFFQARPEDPASNQVVVHEGWMKIANVETFVAEQTTVGFNPVPTPSHIRWDMVYLDESGAALILAGVNQLNIVPEFTGAPDPLPYTLPIAFVRITEAGAVSISFEDITDIRPRLNVIEDRNYGNTYALVVGENYSTSINKLGIEAERVKTFSGKDDLAQSQPVYSTKGAPEYAILDTQSLTRAVANIDVEAERVKTFSGKDDLAQSQPVYSTKGAPEYAILDTQSLAQAVANIDVEAERIKTYAGKDDISQNLPDYSPWTSHNVITPNAPLDQAIAELDDGFAGGPLQLGVGVVFWVAASSPPSGSLIANGALLDASVYSALFAVIGYTYGGGGGFFNLPDVRGNFIRGWDAGRGYDPGRVFGSSQLDELKSHIHSISSLRLSTNGQFGNDYPPVDGAGTYFTNATGGTETRPKNIAFLPCIKY